MSREASIIFWGRQLKKSQTKDNQQNHPHTLTKGYPRETPHRPIRLRSERG